MVDAAKLLSGAGLMLVGKDGLLTWASTSDAHAERAEAVQAEPGAGPCMVACTAKPSSSPGYGG